MAPGCTLIDVVEGLLCVSRVKRARPAFSTQSNWILARLPFSPLHTMYNGARHGCSLFGTLCMAAVQSSVFKSNTAAGPSYKRPWLRVWLNHTQSLR
jgi:hypothetical protein